MTIAERQERFRGFIERKLGITTAVHTSNLFGVSNSAQVVEGGLFLGQSNMDNFRSDKGLVLYCVIRFPPEDEIRFAVHTASGVDALAARLAYMKAEHEAGRQDGYSGSNNNTKLYLAADGQAYIRNKGFWDHLDDEVIREAGQPIPIDQILYAVYPPRPSAKRSLVTREFVAYVVSLVGREKVEEVDPWPEEGVDTTTARRMPREVPLAEIIGAVESLGGYYVDDLIQRYHIGMSYLEQKHFAILTGLSGTGKTRMTQLYAAAVHGMADLSLDDPFYFNCPVRPDWTDPTGLLGYFDVISNRYVVPRFLEAVLTATSHPDSAVFVCLDEMNLARVEYYFADVLSAMESGLPLHLHSHDVNLRGSSGEDIPASIPLPSNLYLSGTVNVDETTNPISDKVLDRAVVIDMSSVDLAGFLDHLSTTDDLANSVAQCKNILLQIHGVLAGHRLAFGYRVAEEFVRYHSFAVRVGDLDSDRVIDHQLIQKVLIKLRGTEEQRELLNKLHGLLNGRPASLGLIDQLLADLTAFGSFQTSR